MSDLSEFLLARIAEDEELARDAIDQERPGAHWQWFDYDTDRPLTARDFQQDGGYTAAYLATTEEFPTESVGPLPAFALSRVEELEAAGPHIARWDPARVLAECEAKRRIVELSIETERSAVALDELHGLDDWSPTDVLRDALGLLALPYADHPDYREEWRP